MTYFDQKVFHAQRFLVVLLPCPHRIDSGAQQLDSAVEVWPCRDVVLCFFDISGDQIVIRTVIRVNLELWYLFHQVDLADRQSEYAHSNRSYVSLEQSCYRRYHLRRATEHYFFGLFTATEVQGSSILADRCSK
jgi:hypothetical protein